MVIPLYEILYSVPLGQNSVQNNCLASQPLPRHVILSLSKGGMPQKSKIENQKSKIKE